MAAGHAPIDPGHPAHDTGTVAMTTPSAPRSLQLAVLQGSLRRGSFTHMLAQTLPWLAPEGCTLRLLPLLHEVPSYDEDVFELAIPGVVQQLGASIAAADALVIVTPEYNYSVPGVLKNALVWLSRLPARPLNGKPIALQTGSPGVLGGARCQYHLRQVLVALNGHVLNQPEVIVGQIDKKLDLAAGRLTDVGTVAHVRRQLQALCETVRAR